jgi:hypothetical protein
MRPQLIVSVCLFFGLMLGIVAARGVWDAFATDYPLETTLTVKDMQDGFAGTTGTVWTIRPDCTFRVSRLFNQKVTEPCREGHLTPEQRARLSEILTKGAMAELPAQLGDASQVNARRITIEYGDKVSVLSIAPGDRDMRALQELNALDPSRRLLDVAMAVKEMLGS